MPRGFPDLFKVSRPQTFLTARRTPICYVTTQELLLELVHPCASEKERRVILRHKGGARNYRMAFRAEKLQKCAPYIICLHRTFSTSEVTYEVELVSWSIILITLSYLNPRLIKKSYKRLAAFFLSSFLNRSNCSRAILKATPYSS